MSTKVVLDFREQKKADFIMITRVNDQFGSSRKINKGLLRGGWII